MAPAASTAVEPSTIGHARTSSGPAVRNEIRPSSRYESADHALEARLGDPELVHERGGVVGLELTELHLDPRREEVDDRLPVVVRAADRVRELARAGQVLLADVEQHEHRLLGQEPEAAHRLRLVVGQAGVADRAAGLELGLEPAQHDLLPLVRLPLGGGAVASAGRESLEPSVDHREVGEDELEIEPLEVARRDRRIPPGAAMTRRRTPARRGAARPNRGAAPGARPAGPPSRRGPRSTAAGRAGRHRSRLPGPPSSA